MDEISNKKLKQYENKIVVMTTEIERLNIVIG